MRRTACGVWRLVDWLIAGVYVGGGRERGAWMSLKQHDITAAVLFRRETASTGTGQIPTQPNGGEKHGRLPFFEQTKHELLHTPIIADIQQAFPKMKPTAVGAK